MTRINFLFCLLSLSVLLLTSAKCRKDKNNNPIDQLPPETQTGANTFGCLVNGEVFKPGGAQLNGGSLNSVYQFIMPNTSSGYTFGVSAKNQKQSCLYKTVAFRFDSIMMKPGIYPLHLQKKVREWGYIRNIHVINRLKNILQTLKLREN